MGLGLTRAKGVLVKKLLLIGTILLAVGCSPRRDKSCPSSTFAMCEPVVYFEYDSAKLDRNNSDNIRWIAEKLKRQPDRLVVLTGYTDLKGRENYNLTLSGRRAIAIQEELILRGVNPNQIKIEAKGMSDPLTTEEERQNLNRRVDVTFEHIPHSFFDACKEKWNELFAEEETEEVPAKVEEVKKAPAKVEQVKADVKKDAEAVKTDAQQNVAEVQADAQQNVVEAQADVQQNVAETQVEVQQTVVEVQADAQQNVVEVQQEVVNVQPDVQNDVNQINQDVQQDVNTIKEDVQQDVNNVQP